MSRDGLDDSEQSDATVRTFEADGYVHIRGLLNPSEISDYNRRSRHP